MNACWAAFVFTGTGSPREPLSPSSVVRGGSEGPGLSRSRSSVCDAIRGGLCGGCECDTALFLSIFLYFVSAGLVLARRTSNIQRDSDLRGFGLFLFFGMDYRSCHVPGRFEDGSWLSLVFHSHYF